MSHRLRAVCGAVALLVAAMPVTASANTDTTEQVRAVIRDEVLRPAPDDDSIFTLAFENDIFSGQDNNYTNGVRLAYLSPENDVPNWLSGAVEAVGFSSAGRKRWSLEVGQNMYTPDDITIAAAQPDDQPWAGLLYGTVGVLSDTGYELDALSLTVGMVGPASGAAETQDFVHKTFGMDRPEGWGNQLKNEPVFALSYEHKWRGLYEFSPFGWGVDISPSVGATVGNLYTHAAVGTVVRFGYDLPSDYGPPLIRPSIPGSDFFVPSKSFGWYLFGGLEGRAVARNIFLDGNTFRDSPSVDKEILVGGAQAGLAITVSDVRIAYTQVFRTKEFEEQKDANTYGAVTVSFRF